MSASPLADVVSRQYERWTYPLPIEDLEVWTRDGYEYFDPRLSHRLFWPDRPYRAEIDILIAGCGTNQAAVFAYCNPRARVVGIDISEASLAHQSHLKSKHQLANLELQRIPIERVGDLARDFDLIVSTGVLHHMAAPEAGMQALARCLRPEGVVALMLYAKYGRVGVETMQSVFRDLELEQDERSLALVKATLGHLPTLHLLEPYRAIANDLCYDAGLVDTFLHGRDRSYSVDDCVALVEGAGLAFQSWLNNELYYPESTIPLDSALYNTILALPEPRVWSIMERLQTRNACHFFVACRADRPRAHYAIDFADARFLHFIPVLREAGQVEDGAIRRRDWRVPINPTQVAMLCAIDGRRTISELIDHFGAGGLKHVVPDLAPYAHNLFRSAWRLGFIRIGLERLR